MQNPLNCPKGLSLRRFFEFLCYFNTMQGKGLVKLFLILILVVSLLQFLYFIPTTRVERAAEEYAAHQTNTTVAENTPEFKLAKAEYLDSISGIPIFSIPLIKSYTYNELKQQQLGLGLDLKGGMSAFLQVDLTDFLKGLVGRNANNTDFVKALENADHAMKTSQLDFITLFSQEYAKLAGPNKLTKLFAKSETIGDINPNADDATVTSIIRKKATETVNVTYQRLKQRIDKLGVTQPNVSLDPNRDLIAVEMPGIDNPKRAEDFLTRSAKLEFWDTYRYTDPGILQAFQMADQMSGGAKVDSTQVVMRDSIVFDATGMPIDTVQVQDLNASNNSAASSSNSLFNYLSINGGTLFQTAMGVAEKSKKKYVDEILARPEIKALFPANSKFMWSYKPVQDADGKITNNYYLYLIKGLPNSEHAPLDGDVVTGANQTLNPVNGQVEVNLRMNASGAKKWAEMTTRAANEGNREIAISLDNEVVSAPSVNGPITGGSSSITGNFSVDEAVDFAGILEVGKLPARTKIIQKSNIGPSLGKENIDKSIYSMLFGFLMVVITILLYYSGAGIVAIISLFTNIFILVGALSSFGTVLTLSGIAGIVLTMGMAVDANVIIFERIKEELAIGKSLKQAIIDGYKHAYSSIIDANLTTMITAVILAYFGLGPVKGFAVVLIIGILTSMFTAIFVARLIIDWWVGKGYSLNFWNGFSKSAFKNINFDWLGHRRIAYFISGGLLLISFISMAVRGFDLGVDYKGGFSYNVQFKVDKPIDADAIREGLTAPFGATPIVKQVDGQNTYNIITSYLIDDDAPDASDRVMEKLYEGVKGITSEDLKLEEFANSEIGAAKSHVVSSAQVGPTIADDLKRTSFIAAILAILGVFLYILFRFNKWQYSVGAIVSLIHDSMLMLGLFSLLRGFVGFSLEIDQQFIAAILTIIGYSINDTVIIFDRIREYLGLNIQKPDNEIINDAINSTLSRTIMTSFTTFITVFILFVFGGSSIKGFAFALMIGIIVGTYSSVFLASPLMADLSKDLKIGSRRAK